MKPTTPPADDINSGTKQGDSLIECDRIFIIASALIALIYIVTVFQAGYLSAFAISFVVFLAGAAYGLRKSEPFLIIISGEILVISNPTITSSLVIQSVLAVLFFIMFVSKEPRILGAISAAYLAAASVFAYGASTIPVFAYLILCITTLICGYLIIQIHRVKIRNKKSLRTNE